jgi:hypothetical protein
MNRNVTLDAAGQTSELEPIWESLSEIGVQIREVLKISRIVFSNPDNQPQGSGAEDAIDLESKRRSFLAEVAATEESIDSLDREIAAVLRKRGV